MTTAKIIMRHWSIKLCQRISKVLHGLLSCNLGRRWKPAVSENWWTDPIGRCTGQHLNPNHRWQLARLALGLCRTKYIVQVTYPAVQNLPPAEIEYARLRHHRYWWRAGHHLDRLLESSAVPVLDPKGSHQSRLSALAANSEMRWLWSAVWATCISSIKYNFNSLAFGVPRMVQNVTMANLQHHMRKS